MRFYKKWNKFRKKKKLEFLKNYNIENITNPDDLKGKMAKNSENELQDLFEIYRGKTI